jgi:hypothetical protein
MLNDDILEAGNRRISDFMERSHVFNYHESWNLLIPVIEKLSSKNFRATLYFNPNESGSTIYDPMNHKLEVQRVGSRDSSIMSVWESVVQFLNHDLSWNESDA